jgi:hypothetical protein
VRCLWRAVLDWIALDWVVDGWCDSEEDGSVVNVQRMSGPMTAGATEADGVCDASGSFRRGMIISRHRKQREYVQVVNSVSSRV